MVLPSSGVSCDDPEVVEVSSSSWVPSDRSKRKRSEAFPLDISEMNEVDPSEVIILEENTAGEKSKQPMFSYAGAFPLKKHSKSVHDFLSDLVPQSFIGSSTSAYSEIGMYVGPSKSFEDEVYSYFEDDTDPSGYDYEESGGELWESDSIFSPDELEFMPGMEAPVPLLQKPDNKKPIKKSKIPEQVTRKPMLFKQFDSVLDSSDHYYNKGAKGCGVVTKPSSTWSKRIHHELKVLEKDLPEMIYVRVYEDRLDLLRAAIVGASGTPYHDGLFFFDVFFPSDYPSVPPLVHYHSGGLRLNPNLYKCGKVCLSLLGTWPGRECERWIPDQSTMLQVLVSIQALVLNAKPYFNEPGFASSASTPQGEKHSASYNEQSFLLSCKTMLYTLRKPPRNFESLVTEHFQNYGRDILVACRAYMNGAQVGCVDADGVQDLDEGDTSSAPAFRKSLKVLFDQLLLELAVKGLDCSEFLERKPISEEPKHPEAVLVIGP